MASTDNISGRTLVFAVGPRADPGPVGPRKFRAPGAGAWGDCPSFVVRRSVYACASYQASPVVM